MLAGLHETEDLDEPPEVSALRGYQWVFFEERHHDVQQIRPTLHREAQERIAMVVVAAALDDRATPEELLAQLQGGTRRGGLRDAELVLDLPAETASRVAHHADREAA